MRFFRDFKSNQSTLDHEPPVNKPVPMHPKDRPIIEDEEQLADLKMVARRLGVSPRYVQMLVQRKVIPVIRLGRRCTRFDLPNVLGAIKRYEIEEIGRPSNRHSPRVS